jgi:hypothetical protein
MYVYILVEFNDYESEKPAADYFTDNMVFPKVTFFCMLLKLFYKSSPSKSATK